MSASRGAAAIHLGDVGRNTMYGPPMKDLDFSAFKDFQLRERTSLQFRAEAFNILNHPTSVCRPFRWAPQTSE